MTDSTAACARGRARPSSSRTQGDALGGTKGEPEDAEMRRYSRVIRVRGVVGLVIYMPSALFVRAGPGARHTRTAASTAIAVMTTALATHHWQIASIVNSSRYVRYALKPNPANARSAVAKRPGSPRMASDPSTDAYPTIPTTATGIPATRE